MAVNDDKYNDIVSICICGMLESIKERGLINYVVLRPWLVEMLTAEIMRRIHRGKKAALL